MADELDDVLLLAYQQMKMMSDELRVSQLRERTLLNVIETEASRRRSAERRAQLLESLLASEIEAHEASESARKMAEERSSTYEAHYHRAVQAWTVAQSTISHKEKALAFAEQELEKMTGSVSSRISDVRAAMEQDQQQSAVTLTAIEGLLTARESAPRQRSEANHAAAAVAASGAVLKKTARLKTQLLNFAHVEREFRRAGAQSFYLERAAIEQAALRRDYRRGPTGAGGELMP